MACAKDIVEFIAPRLAFNIPLGNPAGKPHDKEAQRKTLEHAAGAGVAPGPRTTVQTSAGRQSRLEARLLEYRAAVGGGIAKRRASSIARSRLPGEVAEDMKLKGAAE